MWAKELVIFAKIGHHGKSFEVTSPDKIKETDQYVKSTKVGVPGRRIIKAVHIVVMDNKPNRQRTYMAVGINANGLGRRLRQAGF